MIAEQEEINTNLMTTQLMIKMIHEYNEQYGFYAKPDGIYRFVINFKDKYMKNRRKLSVDEIIVLGCAYKGVDYTDLIGHKRNREFVDCRMIISYTIRKLMPHYSFENIGKKMGGRNHATIINQIDTLKDIIEYDNGTRREVEAFINLCIQHEQTIN